MPHYTDVDKLFSDVFLLRHRVQALVDCLIIQRRLPVERTEQLERTETGGPASGRAVAPRRGDPSS